MSIWQVSNVQNLARTMSIHAACHGSVTGKREGHVDSLALPGCPIHIAKAA